MNEKGSQNFIKLDRRILDNKVMRDSLSFHLFVYCILRAEWQTVNDNGVIVPRGSFMTTTGEIAADLHCSYKNVRTRLHNLAKIEAGYLANRRIGNRLMVTVVHYDKWQGSGNVSGKIGGTENASLPIKEKEYKKGGKKSKWETLD